MYCKATPAGKQAGHFLVIADDRSYPHAGAYGDTTIKTPAFDRIARERVLFDNACISSPSCTPSRAAILTGQHFWRLKEGANLYGPLRTEFKTYTDLLKESGYYVGYTGKGWGPGEHTGRPRNPAGDRYDSFEAFLKNRPEGKPFCFWFGSYYPHRPYEQGSGKNSGINPAFVRVPGWLPDTPEVRNDIADYYYELELFDKQTEKLLHQLDSSGQLDNTLIVVTGDNGMPFPRAKSNIYDGGTRVPLAIRWHKSKSRSALMPF